MPYDTRRYDGIFCFGLIYLLDSAERRKLIRDCSCQPETDGHMIFTVISKKAPMSGQGTTLGDDWYVQEQLCRAAVGLAACSASPEPVRCVIDARGTALARRRRCESSVRLLLGWVPS